MTTPLGSLLSQSWAFFQKHLQAFFLAALLFGVVSGTVQMLVGKSVEHGAMDLAETMGVDPERMEELSKRAAEGDQAATDEMMREIAAATQRFEGMDQADMANVIGKMSGGFLKNIMPALGLAVVLSMVISLLASITYMVMILEGKELQDALGRVPALFLPMLGLWLWVIIRTFAWVPFIGIILAIILGPGLVAAPVILIKEHKGILDSARESAKRTKGYWGKIVGNLLTLGLIFIGVSIGTSIVLAFGGSWVTVFGGSVVQQLLSAFGTVFVVSLSRTVMDNPRRA